MGRVERVRRLEIADLMLLITVVLWSLNFTVTKYVLNHGFKPLAYGGLRFGGAAVVFIAVVWIRERSFAMQRSDIPYIFVAAVIGIFLNSVAFVYGTKLTTATTVALIFGTLPILTALFAAAGGIERLHSRFWVAAAVSFSGVCLVAVGGGGGFIQRCPARRRGGEGGNLGAPARLPPGSDRHGDVGGLLGRHRAVDD